MDDGVYPELSFEEYLALPYLSRSSAMELLPPSTPADYRWRVEHEKEGTDPMRFGSAIHCAILTPWLFGATFTQFSKPANRQLVDQEKAAAKGCLTKIQTEEEEQVAAHDGLTILDHGEADHALELGSLVRATPAVMRLLEGGKPEVSSVWTCPRTGTRAKTRIDWGLGPNGLIVDVKSTRSLAPRHLQNAITEHGYELQAAMGRESCERHGLDWTGHVLIWCRTDPKMRPAVSVEVLTPGWLHRGELLMRAAFRTHAECTSSGRWPGEPITIEPTPEPAWLERWLKDQTTREESTEDFPA